MLHLEAVSKIYHRPGRAPVKALEDVTLTIAQGEFVAIGGPSGSGKSTLLFTMGGLMHPTSGDVRLGATSLYDLYPAERGELRLKQIGFVFQSFNLIPYLTAIENVALPARLSCKRAEEAIETARGLLDQVGLATRLLHRPAELSVGERQRVAIARALINSPKLLLADEPTGNLDGGNADEVMSILEGLNAAGLTVVVVTHDPAVAERAGRAVRLVSGRVLGEFLRHPVAQAARA